MSKRNQKYDNLPPTLPKLQRKIVLCLAKYGDMTMSETNRKVKGENTSTTRAFHELELKDIVMKTGTTRYRGREFSKYWLSFRGLAFALLNKANPESAKRYTLALNLDNETKEALKIYFELRSLSPKIANVIDRFIFLAGKIDPEELLRQLIPELISMKESEIQGFFDKTREFPDYWKGVQQMLTKFMGTMKKIGDHDHAVP